MPLESINPTNTKYWKRLKTKFENSKNIKIQDLFTKDSDRFSKFSIRFQDILFDYSKNRIDQETISLLIGFAKEMKLADAIEKQFSGDFINTTENRAVLHTALRNFGKTPLIIEGKDVMPDINKVKSQVKEFSQKVISGQWKGYSGKEITDIVNIGIGGSDLGPLMVVEGLQYYKTRLNLHFISNVDGVHLYETLKKLNPETTLFIIASKTFTTEETITNALSAKDWFLKKARDQQVVAKHFVAISTNKDEVEKFGIDSTNMFIFWDWVGGRFSLWSSVGLSISLAIGYDNYEELLKGGYEMDMHFKNEDFDKNIPILLALIGIWYNNFWEAETIAILPYEQYLHRFSAYFQQGDMESNGKGIDRNSKKINYQTGPIIWGEPGTNGQHAFYQLIHQGTKLIPCDFIAGANSLVKISDHHEKLLSNFFAQTQALAFGKDEKIVVEELKKQSISNDKIEFLKSFKIFEGNRPTNSILYEILTPKLLGKLISMYEHKIFVQGILLNIFSFDQWGVELGKQLAKRVLPELKNELKISSHDSSTNGLINTYKQMKYK